MALCARSGAAADYPTGVDEEFIRLEVARRVDEESGQIREARSLVLSRMQSELKKNPDAAMETMRQAMTQIEIVEKRKEGYDPRHILSAYDLMFERQMNKISKVEIRTGFPIWDNVMDGLPLEPNFISVPGKPNQGKTSLFSNLAWRIPEFNPNVRTIFHTVDDAISKAVPRIFGSKYKLPSRLFQKAGFFLNTREGRDEVAEKWPHFPQVYQEAQQWLREMVETERLVITDINLLPGTLPALEGWMKTFRKRFPNDPVVCMGDNFALYHLDVVSDSEAVRARQKAQYVKRLANTYQGCFLMTMELTKESLKPGVRPKMGAIKDTQGVAYDAGCNAGVYNDLKDRGDAADLIWHDTREMVPTEVEGVVTMAPRRKPVLEMVIDKNKITDFDGAIWYEFDQVSAELRECSPHDQVSFRSKAETITSRTLAAQVGGSGAPHKVPF